MNLESLDISYNQLTGLTPTGWMQNMWHLRELKLRVNSITGPLPSGKMLAPVCC